MIMYNLTAITELSSDYGGRGGLESAKLLSSAKLRYASLIGSGLRRSSKQQCVILLTDDK